jgi:hypothetical protein
MPGSTKKEDGDHRPAWDRVDAGAIPKDRPLFTRDREMPGGICTMTNKEQPAQPSPYRCETCDHYRYVTVETEGEKCLLIDEFIDGAIETIERVGCASHSLLSQPQQPKKKDPVKE